MGGIMEIERKFQIARMPENLEQYKKKEIEQGYLCIDPVIRIRKSNDNYILTYKSRMGMIEKPEEVALTCQEVELALTKESYEHLKEKTDGNLICKTRYLIPLEEGLTAELDVFHKQLEGLQFVEVEFPGEDEAGRFELPDWFGKDVSFDKRYKNNYLAFINNYEEI
jgi:adenylate cyclase